ncbi:Gfo/Idh/MocA family oxidoreductase [Planctomicrobium sp. SH661]|uniref:Gfo/Idh/MocA family oxidoreductase n=1 Tax=Planctomicrobium sp. SH661 TaxID=3448124 RepID=UPI003F5B6428
MSRLNRRTFLKSTAMAGLAGTLISPRITRADANSKLNLAVVGVGGQGWGDLNAIAASPYVNVVALCDIDESPQFMGRAAEKFSKAERFTDWRKLLELKGIDAVQVSTPDHMHAPVSLAAMALGKHVYCEKPLTHTVQEARLMRQAAEKAKVVTQMGNQIHSHDFYRQATQAVHDGTIGKVKEVFSWRSGDPSWRKWTDRLPGSDPVPSTVHWDNWIGVAPERPYKSECYHSFNWRNWQDFGTGQLGDFGCHILDPVFTSLKLTAPTSIRGQAPEMNKEVWQNASLVEYVFPGTEYTAGPTINVTWCDGAEVKPPREKLGIPESVELPTAGSVLIGEKGFLVIPHVAAPQVYPQEKFTDYKFPTLTPRDHYTSWVDACRGEGETTSLFSYSGPLTETVLLGTIACRLPGELLKWNAPDLKFTGSAAANDLLSKPYRKGWELAKV